MVVIRIPLDQYAYIETDFKGTSDEALVEYKRLVNLFKTPSVSLENTPNLKPNDLLRLLYKIVCDEGLELEEVESLGIDKIYSQKDVLKIVQSIINKSKRETE